MKSQSRKDQEMALVIGIFIGAAVIGVIAVFALAEALDGTRMR